MKRNLVAAAAFIGLVAPGSGAISITNSSFTYSQNFDSLASTGTGVAFTNNSTIAGWSLFRQPAPGTAITAYNADTGSSTTGSFMSYGTSGSSDRALGGLASGGAYFGSPTAGSVAGWIAVAFTNSTGSEITDMTISFDGEQWRNGGNATAQSMVLQWGIGATFGAVTSWTTPGGTFSWTSPVATVTGAAVNGNVAGLVSGRGGALSGLGLSAGSTLWFRWVENNDTGNDHGLAIDNFSVSSVTVVPEPGFALLGSLGILGIFRRRR